MNIIDTGNGNLNLPGPVTISRGMDIELLKQQLTEKQIPFKQEDHYNGMYGSIYLHGIKTDNKTFQFEIHYDKLKMKSISMGFECDKGFEISYDQWVNDLKGNETKFAWGNIVADYHPRFDVPYISVTYVL
ncbi:MAG: hypothetical protein AB7G44_11440 [Bacteroidia bacterium]